ncbi:hypothetical protein LCGC14_1134500 [marine sediment metagenome]|uniref:Uncharacterized protein n=1 Tax=marine sediment metagenome TaxID=412755 RepID=A0A0F9Q5V6_9ZZZZ
MSLYLTLDGEVRKISEDGSLVSLPRGTPSPNPFQIQDSAALHWLTEGLSEIQSLTPEQLGLPSSDQSPK